MELSSLTVGPLQENVYFIIGEQKETLIIDPGDEVDELQTIINNEGLQPIAILLTHAHADHIGAVDALRHTYHIPVYLNRIEAKFLTDPILNLSYFTGKQIVVQPADEYFPAELGRWQIGPFEMELAHIPGHSPGSTVFIFREKGFVIGGDVLFKGSIGRTDFPDGNHEALIEGVHRHLFVLPDEFVVFPGHGEPTTIGEERKNNPFLKS